MEFNYYYQKSKLDAELLNFITPYPSPIGNFSTNSIVSPSGNIHYDISNDLTVFFTYSRTVSDNAVLFSKREDGFDGGWLLGINDNNKLFVEGFAPGTGHIHTFDINLGQKNCLAFKQTDNFFTVYKYDIYSKEIQESETFLFDSSISLSLSGELYVAYDDLPLGDYYSRNKTYLYSGQSLGKPFKGIFDQYAVINAPIDDYYVDYIFQGFCPETVSTTTVLTGVLDSYSIRNPSLDKISSNFINMFNSGAMNFNSYLINQSIQKGNYIASVTGNVGYGYSSDSPSLPGGIVSSETYVVKTGIDQRFCSNTGAVVYIPSPFTLTSPLSTGTSGNFSFNGSCRISRDSNNKLFISHNLTINKPSLFSSDNVALDLDYIYNISGANSSEVITINSGYYSGFEMDGILSTDSYQSTILGTIPEENFYNMNLIASFNSISGLFKVQDSGRMYYNGQLLNPSDYTINNNYIDIAPYNESFDDYLIYDDTNRSMTLLNLSLKTSATGKFWPGNSICFTGVNSYGPFKRIPKDSFVETSVLDSYHNVDIPNIQNQTWSEIEDNWN